MSASKCVVCETESLSAAAPLSAVVSSASSTDLVVFGPSALLSVADEWSTLCTRLIAACDTAAPLSVDDVAALSSLLVRSRHRGDADSRPMKTVHVLHAGEPIGD